MRQRRIRIFTSAQLIVTRFSTPRCNFRWAHQDQTKNRKIGSCDKQDHKHTGYCRDHQHWVTPQHNGTS